MTMDRFFWSNIIRVVWRLSIMLCASTMDFSIFLNTPDAYSPKRSIKMILLGESVFALTCRVKWKISTTSNVIEWRKSSVHLPHSFHSLFSCPLCSSTHIFYTVQILFSTRSREIVNFWNTVFVSLMQSHTKSFSFIYHAVYCPSFTQHHFHV